MKFKVDYCFSGDGWGVGQEVNSIEEAIDLLRPIRGYLLGYSVVRLEEVDVTAQVKEKLDYIKGQELDKML